jgi:FkbM family methyltransferase
MLLKSIKRTVRGYLERRGLELVPKQVGFTLDAAMTRRRDVVVQTVLDVGASDGRWSAQLMKHYPHARYLLVEAQEEAHGDGLRRFKAAHANVEYVLSAAGDREGEIYFDASAPFGGQASPTPYPPPKKNIVVPMAKLDTLVRRHNLAGPFLVKLDTHGFEAPILDGARDVLTQSAMLIIEAYNFMLCPGCLRFHELCAHLETRGFRCADLIEPSHRPGDEAFWQIDLVFLPATHQVFASNEYQVPRMESLMRHAG